MLFNLKFKDFKILSENKERIMLWKESIEGFNFVLEQMGMVFKTFVSYDEIYKKYNIITNNDSIEQCIELFKKEFILSREHTYEYLNKRKKENKIASVVNPIDQFNAETLQVVNDKIVGKTDEGEKVFAELRDE